MHETTHIICGPDDRSARIVYPVNEVARRLGITPRHVWRIARTGAFTVRSSHGISVVDASEFDRYSRTRTIRKRKEATCAQ